MRSDAQNAPVESPGEAPAKLNRRQAAKVRTRQKVIEAARELFAERGYDPATIRDIAKGAGMSTGAVFANFQDKAELFEAVLSEEMDRTAEALRQAAGTEGTVHARLTSALEGAYHFGLGRLPLVQAIMARSWFHPPEAEQRARQAIRGLVDVIQDILRDGVRSGELVQDIDTRLLGEMVWEAYVSNYRRAAYDNWDVKALSERVSGQIQVILKGVQPPHAA